MADLIPRFRLIARTYELVATQWRLTVVHEFYGDTREAAIAIFHRHLQTDRFLAACSNPAGSPGRFGDVVCRTDLDMQEAGAGGRPS